MNVSQHEHVLMARKLKRKGIYYILGKADITMIL